MAPPMMAPAAMPPMTAAPTPQPWQRASAGAGAVRVPAAIVTAAAIARMVVFMLLSRGSVRRDSGPAIWEPWPGSTHLGKRPMHFGGIGSGEPARRLSNTKRPSPSPDRASVPDPRGRAVELVFRLGSVADADATDAPAPTVPEPLTVPVAARAVIDGAGAVIIAGAVARVRGQAADDAGGNGAAARLRGLRRGYDHRGAQRGRGGNGGHCLGQLGHAHFLLVRLRAMSETAHEKV